MADHGTIQVFTIDPNNVMAVSNYATAQAMPVTHGSLSILDPMDDKHFYLQSYAIAGTGAGPATRPASATVGQLYPSTLN